MEPTFTSVGTGTILMSSTACHTGSTLIEIKCGTTIFTAESDTIGVAARHTGLLGRSRPSCRYVVGDNPFSLEE
jgi:hypothetical protein